MFLCEEEGNDDWSDGHQRDRHLQMQLLDIVLASLEPAHADRKSQSFSGLQHDEGEEEIALPKLTSVFGTVGPRADRSEGYFYMK